MSDAAGGPLRVLALGGHAGSAAGVAPVVRALKAKAGSAVTILCHEHGAAVFREAGLDFRSVSATLRSAEAARLLADAAPAVVFAGTSWGTTTTERAVMSAAASRGTAVVAFVDYWANYRERFLDPEGGALLHPTAIAVIDEGMAADMAAAGFPAQSMRIVGSPALEEALRRAAAFSGERRQRLRDSLGIARDEHLVLFVSNPMSADDFADAPPPGRPHSLLPLAARVLAEVERLSRREGRRAAFLLRPHPREAERQYGGLVSAGVTVRVSSAGDARDWVLASDTVIGVHSMLLVEAACMGAAVILVKPAGLDMVALPPRLMRGAPVLDGGGDLAEVLGRAMFGKDRRPGRGPLADSVAAGSVDRLVRLIADLAQP